VDLPLFLSHVRVPGLRVTKKFARVSSSFVSTSEVVEYQSYKSSLSYSCVVIAYIMPQQYIPTGQDWAPANAGRSSSGTAGLKAVPKTAQDLSLAKQRGLVTTEKRVGAGGNQSAHAGGIMSARKLEEADDVGTIAKVDKSLSKAIMQVCSDCCCLKECDRFCLLFNRLSF
jgi:Multiprotein bridging factor 1